MLRADAGPVATVMELRKTKELGIHAVARRRCGTWQDVNECRRIADGLRDPEMVIVVQVDSFGDHGLRGLNHIEAAFAPQTCRCSIHPDDLIISEQALLRCFGCI